MKIIDTFSGMGGFSLAGRMMGWKTIHFVEKDEHCKQRLRQHFPGVPITSDIRDYQPQPYEADIICGGFPCQPFSTAGKRRGEKDDRYLWPEMCRVIRQAKTPYVLAENVSHLTKMDNGAVWRTIRTDLENEGYEVAGLLIPAAAVGAPHKRERLWIVGYSQHNGRDAAAHRKSAQAAAEKGRLQQPERPNTAPETVSQLAANEEWRERLESRPARGYPQYADGSYWGVPWIEVATDICGVDDGLPAQLDSRERADIYEAVQKIGRAAAEEIIGINLQKIEERIQRSERLKMLGNAVVPPLVLEFFKAFEQHNNSTKIAKNATS